MMLNFYIYIYFLDFFNIVIDECTVKYIKLYIYFLSLVGVRIWVKYGNFELNIIIRMKLINNFG